MTRLENWLFRWLDRRRPRTVLQTNLRRDIEMDAERKKIWDELAEGADRRRWETNQRSEGIREVVATAQRAKKNLVRQSVSSANIEP